MIVKRGRVGSYSGPIIDGTDLYPVPRGEKADLCIYRAHWLTAKVETGARFGAIMMADGTGVTAGLDQFVLVYPRQVQKEDFNAVNDQGPLGKLLRRLELIPDSALQENGILPLWNKFKCEGVYLAQDGVFRYLHDAVRSVGSRKIRATAGDVVHGTVLQNMLTPVKGKVVGQNWSRAAYWATLFHIIFSDPVTFKIQEEYGIERMLKNMRRRKVTSNYTAEEIFAAECSLTFMKSTETDPAIDLAFAVWYSNSVNAPGTAMKILKNFKEYLYVEDAKKLVGLLAKSRYGRWHWSIKSGRYQRTRSAAKSCGLWPRDLFDGKNAIMPRVF